MTTPPEPIIIESVTYGIVIGVAICTVIPAFCQWVARKGRK